MTASSATPDELRTALANCLQAATSVNGLRTIYADPTDPYRPGIDAALVELLHLTADLCSKCRQFENTDSPWLDCGPEPLGLAEAQKYLGDFLMLAAESLNDVPVPFMCIEVRATTFALELDTKTEASD